MSFVASFAVRFLFLASGGGVARALLVAGLLAYATHNATGEPLTYRIDPARSVALFRVSQLGIFTIRGEFSDVSGALVIDRAAQQGSVAISIGTASVTTGYADYNEHLRGPDFFDAGRFPRMAFKSQAVVFVADRPTSVEGEMTLLGVRRPAAFLIDWFECRDGEGEICKLRAKGTIRRSEFGMTHAIPMVGDEVKLEMLIVAAPD